MVYYLLKKLYFKLVVYHLIYLIHGILHIEFVIQSISHKHSPLDHSVYAFGEIKGIDLRGDLSSLNSVLYNSGQLVLDFSQ